MEYCVSRVLPWSRQRIWQVLNDVRHFARHDPFHHNLVYMTGRRSGLGTMFRIRHSYLPIFPFAADEVVCTVTQWEPERTQTLLERNRKAYRSHTQRFTLTPLGAATLLEYAITYKGIPSWLVPVAQWVRWRVKRRMDEKLTQIARLCDEGEAQMIHLP